MFKLKLGTENCLLLDIRRKYRVALAKLRVDSHALEEEKGRQRKQRRICNICNIEIEDEYHALQKCGLCAVYIMI